MVTTSTTTLASPLAAPDENGERSSWADAWTENAVIRIDGDTATTMGWMYTEDEAGNVGYVGKTWTVPERR